MLTKHFFSIKQQIKTWKYYQLLSISLTSSLDHSHNCKLYFWCCSLLRNNDFTKYIEMVSVLMPIHYWFHKRSTKMPTNLSWTNTTNPSQLRIEFLKHYKGIDDDNLIITVKCDKTYWSWIRMKHNCSFEMDKHVKRFKRTWILLVF